MKEVLRNQTRLIAIAVGLALFLWLVVSLIQPAAPAQAGLPPRPEPTAVPTQTETVKGAAIKLVVAEPTGAEWTVIEWQDTTTGEWTVVEGWQGTLEADGSQMWWVGREDFGEGPFRWLVYAGQDGALLETSASFTLPTRDLEMLVVPVPAAE
jgi:hypothetical protein